MMKEQKGITLVALIITIIVMLILVGVSISVALNGGLFNRAREANNKTRFSQIKEACTLTKAEILAEYWADTANFDFDDFDVEELINSYLDAESAVTVSGSDGEYEVELPNNVYDEDGNETIDFVIELSAPTSAPSSSK